MATVPPPDRGQASPLRIPILVGAILLGGAAIVLARHYKRPEPPTEPSAPGMTVGSDAVTLANDAPMWGVVKLAPAQPAEPQCTKHWKRWLPGRYSHQCSSPPDDPDKLRKNHESVA